MLKCCFDGAVGCCEASVLTDAMRGRELAMPGCRPVDTVLATRFFFSSNHTSSCSTVPESRGELSLTPVLANMRSGVNFIFLSPDCPASACGVSSNQKCISLASRRPKPRKARLVPPSSETIWFCLSGRIRSCLFHAASSSSSGLRPIFARIQPGPTAVSCPKRPLSAGLYFKLRACISLSS